MKVTTESWSVGKGYSTVQTHSSWLDGDVATKHGLVWCYSQSGNPYTRLDFVFLGRCYSRTFDRFYTKRGVAKKAKEFAEEVVKSSKKSLEYRVDSYLSKQFPIIGVGAGSVNKE